MNKDSILQMEFNYIKDNAGQAISDRYMMLNFYIGICTAVGSVILGLLGMQSGEVPRTVLIGIALLGVTTTVIGWVFVLIMIRLRQAWRESILALNNIKEYFISNNEDLSEVFLWRNNAVPRATKLLTIHFYSTLLVIFLSSSFLAISMGFLGNIVLGIVLGVLNFATQLLLYFQMLRD